MHRGGDKGGLVLFCVFAAILFAFLMFSHNWNLQVVLEKYGELLAIVGGGIVVFQRVSRESAREREKERQEELRRKRTARYWVFYNASNRVMQDLSVIREVYSSQRDFADKGATARRLDHYVRILEGFQQTWKNDDVLNSALSFEFSLLTRPEKRAILDYFANYNEVEDRISLQLPLLTPRGPEKHAGDAGDELPGYPTLSAMVTNREELEALLARLYRDVGGLIVQGIELMELLQYVDDFPGFRGRMESYKAAASNETVEGREVEESRRLPEPLEAREIAALLASLDVSDRVELDEEKTRTAAVARP